MKTVAILMVIWMLIAGLKNFLQDKQIAQLQSDTNNFRQELAVVKEYVTNDSIWKAYNDSLANYRGLTLPIKLTADSNQKYHRKDSIWKKKLKDSPLK